MPPTIGNVACAVETLWATTTKVTSTHARRATLAVVLGGHGVHRPAPHHALRVVDPSRHEPRAHIARRPDRRALTRSAVLRQETCALPGGPAAGPRRDRPESPPRAPRRRDRLALLAMWSSRG